jgi:hypothetical protein
MSITTPINTDVSNHSINFFTRSLFTPLLSHFFFPFPCTTWSAGHVHVNYEMLRRLIHYSIEIAKRNCFYFYHSAQQSGWLIVLVHWAMPWATHTIITWNIFFIRWIYISINEIYFTEFMNASKQNNYSYGDTNLYLFRSWTQVA